MERVVALRPDLVVANKEENRKPEVEALRRECPVFVTAPRTVEQALKSVLDLGTLTGRSREASTMAAGCESRLAGVHPAILDRRIRTVCFVWRDPWMAVGPDTYVGSLLDTFGFTNVFSVDDGHYPQISLDTVLDRGPEVIMLPDEPFEFGPVDAEHLETYFGERGMRVKTITMDGTLLTWFGYRTALGIDYLRQTKTHLLASKE
jgi:ABC-type Fe3+-hydroxamate transport system substrate-binding protein